MDFSVHTSTLRACANRLAANGDDVSVAASYATQHLNVRDTGMFVQLSHVNGQVRAHLADLFKRLEEVGRVSAAELRATAHLYDHTDHGVAVAMDRKLAEVAPVAPGSSYEDVRDDFEDTTPVKPDDYEPPDPGDPAPATSAGAPTGAGGDGGGGSW